MLLVGAAWFTVAYFVGAFHNGSLAFDAVQVYVPAARDVLAGVSPYPALDDPVLRSNSAYVYPPLTALVGMPFTGLPDPVLAWLLGSAGLLGVAATIGLCGVRDWRCYAIVALWPPVVQGVVHTNVSVALALGVALLWRCRDRRVASVAIAAPLVAIKLLLWPTLIWLAATKRAGAALGATAAAAAITLVTWAAIDWRGFSDYPSLVNRLADIEADKSFSVTAAVLDLGLPLSAARSIAIGVALVAFVMCIREARRGRELASLTFALAAGLALTPIVWVHYLLVFLPCLALAHRSFSVVWAAPLILWLAPRPDSESTWQSLFVVAVTAAIVFAVAFPGRIPSSRRRAAASL